MQPEKIVNEGTDASLLISFFNESGTAEAPTSIDYVVTNLTTGDEVQASTNVAAPGSAYSLALLAAWHDIQSAENKYEKIAIDVTANYGDGKQQTDRYEYWIRNMNL